MTALQFPHEGIGEHPIEFRRGESARVFACAGEGMGGGVEVLVEGTQVGGRGAGGARLGTGEGLDFHDAEM